MANVVKDKSVSRFRRMMGYCFEFSHHKHEFRWFWRKPNNSKKKTLRDKRTKNPLR